MHPFPFRFIRAFGLAVTLALCSAGAASALADERPPSPLAPDMEEGELWAAECVATLRADNRCNRRALLAGKPGGILLKDRFVLFLLDGRILARACAGAPQNPPRVRAYGFKHPDGRAMTVFQLVTQCGGEWHTLDLPFSGISGKGVEAGNE